ncbi:MAG: class I SAM-dependent methyltransferase [Anaerolineae bacterium]
MTSALHLELECPPWADYELLDSGAGYKLERFGSYRLVRPEPQAMWRRALAEKEWQAANAVFAGKEEQEPGTSRGSVPPRGPAEVRGEEGSGRWEMRGAMPDRWQMRYKGLAFWAQLTSFRHVGVFPEQASQWEWAQDLIKNAGRPVRILDLFGYTGLASLTAAEAGASVTYVDASKKVMAWARENQALAGLGDRPIRWLVDDALKFVRREARRGSKYDAIILDPPKFGRGPQGEVWKLDEMLPALLADCRAILSERPLFVLLTAYAIRASALSLYYTLGDVLADLKGTTTAGELVLSEKSAGRKLATAIFASWVS